MPIRRLNFTRRRRILRDDIDIVLHEQTSPPTFDAHLNLEHYHFPPDARVFVEAYRQTTVSRFDFGTVSVPSQPASTSLGDFESPAAILFRVRITATSGSSGILLGVADRLRPREPDEKPDRRIPLLPPKPDDLGEELWRVEFSSTATYLVINSQLPDWKETARDPQFRALAFPAAMRRILERILYVDDYTTADDDQDWHSLWLRFASMLPGSGPVPRNRDDYDDWIEDAVAAFARRTRLRTAYNASERG